MNVSGFPIKIYRVAERSMEPSIREGSYAIVIVWRGKFRKGDVVLLRSPESGSVLIKRVWSVKGNSIFAVGDNRVASIDSRRFGHVDVKRVIGKVILVI